MSKLAEEMMKRYRSQKGLEEADISIDTDLSKNELSMTEEKLLNLISVARHFDNLNGIQLHTTPSGNWAVYVDGKSLLTINGNQFSEDELDDLRADGYFDEETRSNLEEPEMESENLVEAVVPASNMDFKHQQLAQVQDMIKVIAELKAEDNSNTLYTELLDGYDKLIKILTDAITEDPVGTVVGDGFSTGLQSEPEETSDEEVPTEVPEENEEELA